MKNSGLTILLILFLTSIGFSQNSLRESINKLKCENDLTKVALSGFLINLAGSLPFTGLEKEEKVLLRNIKSLIVLSSEGKDKVNFYERLKPEIESNHFEQLLSVREEDERVLIMGKPSKNGLSDLLVITSEDGDETLVHIQGNFDAEMIWKLANQ